MRCLDGKGALRDWKCRSSRMLPHLGKAFVRVLIRPYFSDSSWRGFCVMGKVIRIRNARDSGSSTRAFHSHLHARRDTFSRISNSPFLEPCSATSYSLSRPKAWSLRLLNKRDSLHLSH